MATTTAAERRAHAKSEFDSYLATCASRHVLDRLADKWVTLVLCALGDHGSAMRYSELSRRVAGVSQKMLTQTLRALERDGLVCRTVTPTVPVTVDYDLTPLGASLLAIVRGLKRWADTHVDQILTSREEFDAR
ncbi:Transcriptional regulator, HxlR family [Alloactinosynnema sp. L-07]|uniref:winged helix-turn-helix transcriptional regulator n=1 Tax=Alloactinosynnema sp. L-07 TaxID=1653480 RepID=UPI00065EFEAB|nr:helix-turn-helix domain-containing protein [Alloactinosynnema sp. L-07]CRK56454.1 Transcriptional regulator, HxlR family [Alloactinosynnema sp. L-07]